MNIDIAEGRVKLGGVDLPGAVARVSIGGKAIVDKQKTVSGDTKKQTYGFDPKDLSINMVLDNTDTTSAFDQLETIEKLFDNKTGLPQKYRVNSFHTRARRLKDVLFVGLTSGVDNRNDLITVDLQFEEWSPVFLKIKDSALENVGSKSGTELNDNTGDSPMAGINTDPLSAFAAGFGDA